MDLQGSAAAKLEPKSATINDTRRKISFVEMLDLGTQGSVSNDEVEKNSKGAAVGSRGSRGPPGASWMARTEDSGAGSSGEKKPLTFLEFLDLGPGGNPNDEDDDEDDDENEGDEAEVNFERMKASAGANRVERQKSEEQKLAATKKKELTFLEFLDLDPSQEGPLPAVPATANATAATAGTSGSMRKYTTTSHLRKGDKGKVAGEAHEAPAQVPKIARRPRAESESRGRLSFFSLGKKKSGNDLKPEPPPLRPYNNRYDMAKKRSSVVDALDLEKTGYVSSDEEHGSDSDSEQQGVVPASSANTSLEGSRK